MGFAQYVIPNAKLVPEHQALVQVVLRGFYYMKDNAWQNVLWSTSPYLDHVSMLDLNAQKDLCLMKIKMHVYLTWKNAKKDTN